MTLQADVAQARAYIAALTGDGDAPVTFQTFDDHGRDQTLARIMHGTIGDCAEALERLNNRGAGVFVTVNRTDGSGRRKNDAIVGLRALFIDCDSGWPALPLRPPPSLVVRSANGPHVYWLLTAGEPLDAFRDAQRALAGHYGTDVSVNDLARVMRLPGFWHRKAEPELVTLERSDADRRYGIGEVAPDMPAQAPVVTHSASQGAGATPGASGALPRFTGDVRTLDVPALFGSRGLYRRRLDGNRHAVVCPWADSHTRPDLDTASGDTSTVAWESDGDQWPGFKCLHAHCDGRSIVDVIAAFGADVVDRYCASGWRPEVHEQLIERSRAWRTAAVELRTVEAELAAEAAPIERSLILVGRDNRDVRDDALEAIARHPGVYVSGGVLANIGDGHVIKGMTRGSTESALCDVAEWRKQFRTGLKPAGIPDYVPRILLSLSRQQAAKFRRLDVITKTPFWTPAGVPVTEAGYNREARAVLVDPPPVRHDLFDNGAAALAWLCDEVLGDFPWGDAAERANMLGAMLVPMVRPMIRGPVPLHNIEASKRGSGKTLLAQLLMTAYGFDPEMSTLPRDEAEVEKKMLAVLRAGLPIHVWDNVKHAVTSAALDIVLTSTHYSGRLLGQSVDLRLAVRQLWIMTSNNARLSDDMSRRTVRIRLVSETEFPEDRQGFRHSNLLDWTRNNRSLILSALWQCVHEWIEAGQPRPPEHARRTLGSYHGWATVIGGILANAGELDFLANARRAREEQNMDAGEWPEFLEAWWDRWHRAPASSKQLWDVCDGGDYLVEVRGGGNKLSQIKRLSNALRSVRDSIRFGFKISMSRDNHRKAYQFALDPIDDDHPEPELADVGDDDSDVVPF